MRCWCLRSWWNNTRVLRNDINKVVTSVTCYLSLYFFTFLSPDCSNPTPVFFIPIADSSTIKIRVVSGWLLNVEGRPWSLVSVNGTGYSSTVSRFRVQHLYTNSPHSYFIHNLCYWQKLIILYLLLSARHIYSLGLGLSEVRYRCLCFVNEYVLNKSNFLISVGYGLSNFIAIFSDLAEWRVRLKHGRGHSSNVMSRSLLQFFSSQQVSQWK